MDIERLYGWEAVDRDGRVYTSDQMNAENRGGYDALPHYGLSMFRITMFVHQRDGGIALAAPKKFNLVTLHLDEDESVLYRKRREMRIGQATRAVILVGARKTVRGRDVQRLCWIFQDTGEVHMTGRFREDDAWFYSPEYLPQELAT